MIVRFLEVARAEFEAAAEAYDRQREGRKARFQDAVRVAVDRITLLPESGSILEGEYRRCLLKRFPYSIIYHAAPEEIVIIAVYHQHRRPGRWKGRA